MASNINAIGKSDGAELMFVKSIPIIIGKITMAPSTLVLGMANNKPPRISAKATKGISQLTSMSALINFTIFSGKSSGIGM
tara:strand:+ start:677 stop:919 length:243 start_codon:yes stop_codon:yes gene_type:complete